MKVITISGSAGCGKDTMAKTLKGALERRNQRVLITHYADLLKYVCKQYLGWNGEKDEAGRTLLQHVGTDYIREKIPNFWVAWVALILTLFDDKWDYVLIPDTRFPNEISYLKDNGFDVTHIRIVRPGFENTLTPEQRGHASETALDDIEPDILVTNDGSLLDFDKNTDELAEEIVNAE